MPYKFNGKELDEETGLYYYGARYMNPVASIWYGVDPLAEKYPNMGAYTYCLGNPVKLVDPDGQAVETVWDAANVAIGVASFIGNVSAGNIGAAIVDGIGVAVDATATAVPFVPGGAGTAIKTYRAGKAATRAVSKASTVVKAGKTAKTANNTSKVTRRAAFRQAKRDAGIPTSQNFKTHKKVNAAKNGKSDRMGIEYEFDVARPYGGKESRFVQDHYEGHTYMDGRVDKTPHFNIHQKKGSTPIKGEKNIIPM